MFVDRERELAALERAWASGRAELLVLYGRRRVGKTALLRAFAADRPGALWVATTSSESNLRQSFTDALWRLDHPAAEGAGFCYDDWERAFRALGELARERRVLAALDEFPYLVSAAPAVPSILQKVWDDTLQHTRLMLALSGSHLGMMERALFDYRAPLYGRRTGQIALQPLPLAAAKGFFPRYSAIEQIEAYGVLGGVPAYLSQFDDSRPLLTNIAERLLDPASFLYHEPHFLLREELQEPRHYFALLQAIAQGNTQLHLIAQAAGMERGAASRYLATLQELRLVERRIPATERDAARSRKGLYRLGDPYLAFWFRFVAPYFSLLEAGYLAPVLQRIETGLSQFVSFAFEDLARRWVVEQAARGALGLTPDRVGAWWDRASEFDVLALSDAEGAALAGECKWWAQPVGLNVLRELQAKARGALAGGPWSRVAYLLFARSGFTPELVAVARAEGVRLVAAEELVAP